MTEYHPTYAVRVRDLSIAGLRDAEIARLLGISVSTMQAWAEKYPDFHHGWKDGKLQADAKVVGALFKKACGYTTTKWKETKDGMFQEKVEYPPDTAALMYWLNNRMPDQFKSRVEVDADVSGTIGVEGMSDVEVARRIAFALSKATQQLIEGETNGQRSEPQAEQPFSGVDSPDDGG